MDIDVEIDPVIPDHQPFSTMNGTALSICFVFLSLGLGSFLKEFNKATKIPFSPMLFILGLAAGMYWDSLGIIGQACKHISEIEPSGVLIIFLPTMIYESGYNFDWHLFKRLFAQILILAFPCVIILSVGLQLCVKVLLNYQDDYFTWESAFMFGAMLSCTDTVAVLALLKESGASKKFQSLIEGESLLNDGACMVLFQISYAIVKGHSAGVGEIIGLFMSLCFGGTFLGIVFGLISVYWIKKIFNDEILVLNITIVSCYLVFFVAENVHFGVHLSGVLGLVSLSLFMAAFGRSRISHEADHALLEFWEYVVYASETLIFLLGGIIAGIRVFKEDSEITRLDFYKMLALWGCLMVCRFISIASFFPWLKRYGYGLKWAEVLVLTYGGLRGSIGIAFALIVAKDEELPTKWRDIILFHMSGIAVCTLVVNATTLGILIRVLGLSTSSDIREKIYANFLQKVCEEVDNDCSKNMKSKYLREAQWEVVKDLSGMTVYQKECQAIMNKIEKKDKMKSIKLRNLKEPILEDDDDDKDTDIDMLIEIRRIFLMALKGIYMEMFERNTCSPDTLILLTESTNMDLDNDKEPMNSWDFLLSQFSERYINFLFYLKDNWLLGRTARSQLFTYIYSIYDVVSSYTEALAMLKEEASHYNFPENMLLEVINEVDDNRKSANQYIEGYLQVSFPEISKELHTKKAILEILEFQKSVLKNNLLSGQLTQKEFLRMKRTIDRKVTKLNDLNPSWELPSLLEVLENNPLFKNIPLITLKKLIVGCREDSFGRDQLIFKEGDRVNEIMIITRGAGAEYSDTHKVRERRVINEVVPVYMIVAPSIRYQTSFVAECVINATFIKIASIKSIIKLVPEFEEAIWRYSVHLLSRIYSENMKPLCYLKKSHINDILSKCIYVKARRNTIIRIEQGCILLKGTLIENRGNIQEIESEDDDNIKQQEPVDGWKKDAICIIAPVAQPLRSLTSVILLAFKHYSIIESQAQPESNTLNKRVSSHSSRSGHIRQSQD